MSSNFIFFLLLFWPTSYQGLIPPLIICNSYRDRSVGAASFKNPRNSQVVVKSGRGWYPTAATIVATSSLSLSYHHVSYQQHQVEVSVLKISLYNLLYFLFLFWPTLCQGGRTYPLIISSQSQYHWFGETWTNSRTSWAINTNTSTSARGNEDHESPLPGHELDNYTSMLNRNTTMTKITKPG